MRRRTFVVAIGIVVLAATGLLSNVVSLHRVETDISALNRGAILFIDRLWRIAPRPVHLVNSDSVVYRSQTIEAKKVHYQLPPATPLPFEYAHASSLAPFVLRVRYGWADGGERMAFGEGGEYLVASFFGTKVVILHKKPHWYL